ncbi:ABC transporter ATP-binding protein [Haloglomus litoreum]|uniref:ABC transporter ATP-binding protein n=1 Tax=Haloglomus litoreum TaxID=3034026 RepID=UPI0023E7DA18|nr:ABC transporter ATP-binding protein [Haloglomus sp. DT116]
MATERQGSTDATDTAEPVLAAAGVSVDRGGTRVLTDVSLAVPPQARILIRGPSGAGKSTLFRVLGLLEPPNEGRILVSGTDAASLPERKRAALRRDHVGIVFQDFQLVPDLTARENAALPQEHGGDRDGEWLDELFERLDIVDLADQYPASLSGGEKQRVAIARALANRPAVVLADEPTGQLDPDTEERVLDLLDEATRETALVVVSHDRALGERFERVVTLRDGEVLEDVPASTGSD